MNLVEGLLDMAPVTPAAEPLDRVLTILNRFPSVVRRLAREHPGCRTLVFFVYDPKVLLKNPAGLADLEKEPDLRVRVVVQPK